MWKDNWKKRSKLRLNKKVIKSNQKQDKLCKKTGKK